MNLLKMAQKLYRSQQPISFHACLGLLCLAPSLLLANSTVDVRDAKTSKIKPRAQKQIVAVAGGLDQVRPSYIYRTKQTDTPESIAFEFLDEAHSPDKLRQFFARNRIDKKAIRKPVAQNTPFNIPVKWMYLKPSRANVLSVSGVVTVTQQTAQNINANNAAKLSVIIGTPLTEGSRIQTAANSFVSIALPDGSILLLEPNSDITLDTLKQYASSDIFKINIVLNKGRVESEVKPLTSSESTYTIKSKRLVTGVRGTRFAVADSGDGTGKGLLEVLEGSVALASPTQGSLNTIKGFGRTVELLEPSASIVLLPQPIWHCDQSARFSIDTTLSLTAPDQTAHVKVDIFSGKHNGLRHLNSLSPVKQYITSYASNKLALDLPTGDYTAVARAVDVNGLQGYGSIQTITTKPAVAMIVEKQLVWRHDTETVGWVWRDIAKPADTLSSQSVQTLCSIN
jgi:hypothetical protein